MQQDKTNLSTFVLEWSPTVRGLIQSSQKWHQDTNLSDLAGDGAKKVLDSSAFKSLSQLPAFLTPLVDAVGSDPRAKAILAGASAAAKAVSMATPKLKAWADATLPNAKERKAWADQVDGVLDPLWAIVQQAEERIRVIDLFDSSRRAIGCCKESREPSSAVG